MGEVMTVASLVLPTYYASADHCDAIKTALHHLIIIDNARMGEWEVAGPQKSPHRYHYKKAPGGKTSKSIKEDICKNNVII